MVIISEDVVHRFGPLRDHGPELFAVDRLGRRLAAVTDRALRFGPWQTVHGRFARWAADETFGRLLAAAQQRPEVDWLVALDSTIVRAHQHTAAKGGSRNEASDAPAAG